MQAKWLDRTLITSPIYYTICTSQQVLDKELKRLKIKDALAPKSGGASTHFISGDNGNKVAIVTFFEHSIEPEQVLALLTHEAVHIWQEIKVEIGELHPSNEFEAYSIQQIVQNLLYEYNRQLRTAKKCRRVKTKRRKK